MDAETYVDGIIEMRRNGMIERASWISDHRPQFTAGMVIQGGEEATILYDDAQISYIDGVFSGAIFLGQSFIERSVCGMAYSAGEFDENDRPGYHDAVGFLENNGILAPDSVDGVALDKLHKLRNPVAHFRPPTDRSTIGGRIREEIRENPDQEAQGPNELLQRDAERVLKSVFSVVRVFGIGSALK